MCCEAPGRWKKRRKDREARRGEAAAAAAADADQILKCFALDDGRARESGMTRAGSWVTPLSSRVFWKPKEPVRKAAFWPAKWL